MSFSFIVTRGNDQKREEKEKTERDGEEKEGRRKRERRKKNYYHLCRLTQVSINSNLLERISSERFNLICRQEVS